VAVRKRTLDEEHPDTLSSIYALASRYSEVGRRQEVLQLTETVVIANKRMLGEEYSGTLSSTHALVIRYSEVGRRQEALQQGLFQKIAGRATPWLKIFQNMNNLFGGSKTRRLQSRKENKSAASQSTQNISHLKMSIL
jgi:Tetratricopeptide repeat